MDHRPCFFGFEINADLYHSCVQVIKALQSGSPAEGIDRLAADNVIRLTDTGFDAYYTQPGALVEIPSVIRKAADAGVAAVQKGVHLVVRKVIVGTTPEQLKIMGDYMAELLCESKTSPGRYYVCFTLPVELFELAQTLLARVRTDPNVDVYRWDVVAALERLIEAGIEAYYTRPVSQANLGRFTRSAADLGIKTAHKGISAVLHKLFKNMPHDAMLPLAAYFESLLHDDVTPLKADMP